MHGFGGIVEFEEAVNEAAGEAVAAAGAAGAVHDFKAPAVGGAVECAIVPADRAPVIEAEVMKIVGMDAAAASERSQ